MTDRFMARSLPIAVDPAGIDPSRPSGLCPTAQQAEFHAAPEYDVVLREAPVGAGSLRRFDGGSPELVRVPGLRALGLRRTFRS